MSQHSDEKVETKPDVWAMSQRELMTEMANRCARISATNREILSFITPGTKYETALHALVGLSCETIDAMVERIKAPSVDEAAKPAPGGPKMREEMTEAQQDAFAFLPSGIEVPAEGGRGVLGRIADAAWPFYGGDVQGHEFWWGFCEGARFTLHVLPQLGLPEPTVPEVPARVDGEGE